MSLEVADLVANLRLDAKQYNTSLTKAGNHAKQFTDDLTASSKAVKRAFDQVTKSVKNLESASSSAFEKVHSLAGTTLESAEVLSRVFKLVGQTAKQSLEPLKQGPTKSPIAPIPPGVMESYKEMSVLIDNLKTNASDQKEVTQKANTAIRRTIKTTLASYQEFELVVSSSLENLGLQFSNLASQVDTVGDAFERTAQRSKKAMSNISAVPKGSFDDLGYSIHEATEGLNKLGAEEKKIQAENMSAFAKKCIEASRNVDAMPDKVQKLNADLESMKQQFRGVGAAVDATNEAMARTPKTPPGTPPTGPTNVGQYLGPVSSDMSLVTTKASTLASVMNKIPVTLDGVGQSSKKNFSRMRQLWDDINESSSIFNNTLGKTTSGFGKMAAEAKRAYHPVMNIFKGIILAQGFYKTVNAIQSGVAAMWEMSKAAETTQRSFAVMLKDVEMSKALTEYIKDFAATSTFTFESASSAARQLLAYGFQVENVGYLMKQIGDAAAAMGNQEAFGSIVKALGQMQTKGKLATQEIIQLTEAGIPAYEILREELQLTEKQMGNLGRSGIKASDAIEALLNGMQKRFGGAMAEMEQTTQGLINNVKESITNLGATLMQPMMYAFRSFLKGTSSAVSEWAATLKSTGLGGLFEQIVPKEFHDSIRALVANLDELRVRFAMLWEAAGPALGQLVQLGLAFANLALPVFHVAQYLLTSMFEVLNNNTVAMRLFVASVATLTIFSVVNKVFATFDAIAISVGPKLLLLAQRFVATAQTGSILGAVLGFLKSLFTGGLGLPMTIAAFASLGATIGILNGSFSNMSSNLGDMFGKVKDNYLQPSLNAANDAAYNFDKTLAETNDELEDAEKNTDKLGDAAKKAGKKAKDALMSFDEIFNLKPEDETGADKNFDDMFEMPELEALPDFSMGAIPGWDEGWAKDYATAESWWTKTKRGFKSWWSDTAKGFSDWFGRTSKGFGSWFSDTFNGFGKWIGDTYKGLDGWIKDTVSGFTGWVSDSWKALTGWWDKTVKLFSDWRNLSWSDIWGWIKDTGKGFGDWVLDSLGKFDKWVGTSLGSFGTWVTTSLGKFGSWSIDSAKKFGSWVDDTLRSFSSWSGESLKKLGNWALDSLGSIGTWARDAGSKFWKWSGDSIQSFGAMAGGSMEKLWNFGSDAVSWISSTFKTNWDKAWRGITGTFSSLWNGIGDGLKSALNWCIEKLNDFIGLWNTKVVDNFNKVTPGTKWDVGHVGKIPYMAKGGLVQKQTLAMVGERGRKEAVMPLEDERAMSLIGEVVGRHVSEAMAGGLSMQAQMLAGNTRQTPGASGGANQVVINAYAMDDANVRTLLRKLRLEAEREQRRTFQTQPVIL